VRPDATPVPGHLGPAAAAPRFLRELAHVSEIDLAKGLGPERVAALVRLADQAAVTAARRRRRQVSLAFAALALAGAIAAALQLR
jgi:hypothetical protein